MTDYTYPDETGHENRRNEMYQGYEIKERQDGAAEILRALAVRDLCQGGPYGVDRETATRQHMDMVYQGKARLGDIEGAKADVQRERELLEAGERYFEQGYRFRRTHRNMVGVWIGVPEEALAWVNTNAGHIGTVGAHRIEYVIRRIQDTLTPAEIEAEYGLADGTVTAYLRRHPEMEDAGESRKADGRTWLVLRSAAERIWGHED